MAQPGASLNLDRDRNERATVLNKRAHESSTVRRHAWLSVFANSCCETLRLVLGRRAPPEIKIDPIWVRCVEQTSARAGKREQSPARRAHDDLRFTTARRHTKDLRWLPIPGCDGLEEVHELAIGRPRGPVGVPTASRGHEFSGIAAVGVGNHDGITAGFAGTHIDNPRSVGRPSQRASGFNELARRSAERCRDEPRVERRRATPSLSGLDCDAASVGGDL